MRIFYGIEFNNETKNELINIVDNIRPYVGKGNYSLYDNYHLTLRFIGEVETNDLTYFIEITNKINNNLKSFDLKTNKIGIFPKKNSNIIWLGINDCINLNQLVNELDIQLSSRYQFEDYKPHITLIRNGILKNDLDNINEIINISPITINIKKITLFHSTRVNDRLTYIPLN